ncbi:MAG: NAD(P)/FAD-dependent oxidoreductase [Ruminococcaceae bacterium]|nr:NAD(P)/FAD-dependent oxidoreductase [Oscillospiraceae bacterium]
MNIQSCDVVIIGGGPAGMIAACEAAERGRSVVLLEWQKFCGRKLRITGKGRCNVTNNCEIKPFMQNVPGNAKFLFSALNRFSTADTIAMFESLGVPMKTERGNRVFPVSDNAHDVAKALEKRMLRSGVKIVYARAQEILTEDGSVSAVRTDKGLIKCAAAAICTGGVSYPLTGSTGDGHRMAKALGHTVTDLRPSLVPLESDDGYCAEMQGFSLKNVTLKVFNSADKLIFSELGEMMFTHFGVTGPLVLSASAHMRDFEHEKYRLEIDLKPALDEKKLDARILRDFEKFKNREFANSLSELAGRTMIPVIIALSGIAPETRVNSITKEQRKKLLSIFKAFPVSISGTRPLSEAIVTAGGVSVKEVDPRTMESKIVSGLYFAGEVLDLDAYTGGFNLQIAWSTGYVAGQSV